MIKEILPFKYEISKFKITEKIFKLISYNKIFLEVPIYFDKIYIKFILKYTLKKKIHFINSLNKKKKNKIYKKIIVTFK